MVEDNLSMQVKKGVSKEDPSNARRSFFPSLQIRPYWVRHKPGKKSSSQHGNAATHFSCFSLFQVVSAFFVFLEMEGWLPQARNCLLWSALVYYSMVYEFVCVTVANDPF